VRCAKGSFDLLSNRSEISVSTFRILADAESLVKAYTLRWPLPPLHRARCVVVQGAVCSRAFRVSLLCLLRSEVPSSPENVASR
jgi:hypothetical protein